MILYREYRELRICQLDKKTKDAIYDALKNVFKSNQGFLTTVDNFIIKDLEGVIDIRYC